MPAVQWIVASGWPFKTTFCLFTGHLFPKISRTFFVVFIGKLVDTVAMIAIFQKNTFSSKIGESANLHDLQD